MSFFGFGGGGPKQPTQQPVQRGAPAPPARGGAGAGPQLPPGRGAVASPAGGAPAYTPVMVGGGAGGGAAASRGGGAAAVPGAASSGGGGDLFGSLNMKTSAPQPAATGAVGGGDVLGCVCGVLCSAAPRMGHVAWASSRSSISLAPNTAKKLTPFPPTPLQLPWGIWCRRCSRRACCVGL